MRFKKCSLMKSKASCKFKPKLFVVEFVATIISEMEVNVLGSPN